MRRDQLEHAIRTACQIIGKPEVIIVGSQSILGTFSEDQLPADATMSVEIDIIPIADDNAETAAPDGEPQYTGWCLDKEDLCVAKLCAFREKDRNFVAALVRSALVDRKTILTRLSGVDERYLPAAEVAASWLRSL